MVIMFPKVDSQGFWVLVESDEQLNSNINTREQQGPWKVAYEYMSECERGPEGGV